jgi:endoglucanase
MNNLNKMCNLDIILIIFFFFSLLMNYIKFNSKKTALRIVNDMGIGYNLGNTYNCCNIVEFKNSENEEIKLLGTSFPTKNFLKEIKKFGFKTIRFQILYNYIYNDGKINSEIINKIKGLINLIINLNMYLILSIKHTRQFWDSEGKNSKDKYINFWGQIAKELIIYDNHLIFESMYEIGYLTYLSREHNYFEDKDYYLSQDFINIIRNSGGLNTERLLIIPMISSDYELGYFSYYSSEYKFPKDPYNNLAISLNYYFPFEEYNLDNKLEPINLYNKFGFSDLLYLLMEWGSSLNYKIIVNNFDCMKKNFVDKGFPIIIGEVGFLNDYNKKNNSIEQFLYTLFSMSYEYEGILPCLWDIPLKSKNYNNFYFNKENNEWSDDKYGKIFNKISKGKFIKAFDYYHQTNLEFNDYSINGFFEIKSDFKRIVKIIVNVKFFIHIDREFVLSLYAFRQSDSSYLYFDFKEKNGKKQYDGTTIFTLDASKYDLGYYIQAMAWYPKEYMIINNLTVQYDETFLYFDYLPYKKDILNDINY